MNDTAHARRPGFTPWPACCALLGLMSACAADGLPLLNDHDSGAPVDMSHADLMPPPTVRFVISSFTGTGVTGDTTTVSFPLPTPTQPPIDGINYLLENLHGGDYDFTLAWRDQTNHNQGWTASFAGAPGLTPGWPVTSERISFTAPGSSFGVKVAVVAEAPAAPNTVVFTVRSVANPQTDYGVLDQGVRGLP